MLTPSIFRQLLHAIPGNGAGSAAAAAWCRFRLRPAVSEDDLGRLATVQLEVVSLGPLLHVGELCGPRRLIAGRDDDVRVVGVLAHRISWHSFDEVSGVDDLRSWSNG